MTSKMTGETWQILFMGTSPFACPSLEKLLEKGEVVGVFTQPDRPQGRGLKVRVSPIKALALKNNLPIYQPESINQEEYFELIKKIAPDLIVVVAFGQILSPRILGLPKWGCINLHASLLPKYRGAAPINWAIIRGEKVTGVTTMLMDQGLDTGDILMQRKLDILPEENAGGLHDRLAQLGAETLIETIEKWKKGEIVPQKQEGSEATYAPPLKKEDGLIDWGKPAEMIYNQIRGMNPWPGAYTYLAGKRLKIFRTKLIKKVSRKKPGTVLDITDEGIVVGTGEGRLLLTEIQLESRKRISADKFLRGYPLPAGTQLGE
jgi:methionyl-tRNA formyltransferase